MGVGVFDHLRNRLAVGNLRLAHLDVNVVRATQNVDLDVEVQLTHALDQRFAGVFVGRNLEGGVFLNHLVQRDAHLLGTGLVFRRNRDRDHRIREYHRLERCRIVGVRQRMARARVLHAEQGDDVAGLGDSSSSRESACISTIRPMRSVLPVNVFRTLSPFFSVPE